jgi:hypothetical protein
MNFKEQQQIRGEINTIHEAARAPNPDYAKLLRRALNVLEIVCTEKNQLVDQLRSLGISPSTNPPLSSLTPEADKPDA